MARTASAKDLLHGSGLKLTKARAALLKALQSRHGPHSVAELQTRAGCDLVTAYRFLAQLDALKIVSRCDLGDGVARYELARHGGHHHHHIVCRVCSRVEPLADCPLPDIGPSRQTLGFHDVSHRLEFTGVCPRCQ